MDYYQDSYRPDSGGGYDAPPRDGYGGGGGDYQRQNNPPLLTEKIFHDRKEFFLDLKENQRGRFLKITEDVGGRRDTIMLPSGAFKDFLDALQRLVEFEGKL